ncbi:phosphatidylserine decarboxylase [Deinococcus sp. Arct2-2]|uniref:phosphatidylserine decarboxylase n=1 Tax=Deinococcus sp. Arct2-2 TaxID=2568653 RepID=UPI0010A50E04|nr:phosphatidylserine decarboxylase [Deinococcus sp. Arct2-2]THF68206.1 phosphatidylserine decarboxylase [Deinococcus sp. Arct2-2]
MTLLRRLLPVAAAGAALYYVRGVYRFRDPVRLPPADADTVLAPADGVVCFVKRVTGGQIYADSTPHPIAVSDLAGLPNAPQSGWLMGLYMGPLDVHFTYHPVSGPVTRTHHTASRQNTPLLSAGAAVALLTGRSADLLATRGTLENERHALTTHTIHGEVTTTLVAPGSGLSATTYTHEADTVRAGNKSAFLDEGGLVFLLIPAAFTPQVSVGERVLGAETVVARAEA